MRGICTILLLFMSLPLQAATYWSAGVSAGSGWFDFNKTHQKGKEGDDLLCWAVAASNLLAWWQQQNPERVPQGTPQAEAVWMEFQRAFENEGSDPDQGLRWWFSGEYLQQTSANGGRCAALREGCQGGFYRDKSPAPEQVLYNGRGAAVTAQSLTEALLRGFRRGDAFWLGASCRKPDGSRFMHSITVWGVDAEMTPDGKERVTAIYMCDSDDRAWQLHRIPLREAEGMLALDCAEHPVYGRLGLVTLDTYTGLRVQMKE